MTACGRWWRRETGTATVEFVLVFPLVTFVFFAALETGLFMTRHVMFDRAVDMAMRDLRLGLIPVPKSETLKKAICDRSVLMEDCAAALKIELSIIDTATWVFPEVPVDCVDRSKPMKPSLDPNVGEENDIMLVRACITADAMFPTTGIALRLPQDGNGGYYIASVSGFVNEP